MSQARDLNYPLHAKHMPANVTGWLPPSRLFAELDSDLSMFETIKAAEDQATWTMRVWAYTQFRSSCAALRYGQPIARAVEGTVMEQAGTAVSYNGRQLEFAITLYAIKPFNVWLDGKRRGVTAASRATRRTDHG